MYQTQNPNPTPQSELIQYDYFMMPRESMYLQGGLHPIRPETLQLDAIRRAQQPEGYATNLPDMNRFVMTTEDGNLMLDVRGYEDALRPTRIEGDRKDDEGLLNRF